MEINDSKQRLAWVTEKIKYPDVELIKVMRYNAELNEHYVSEHLNHLENNYQEWLRQEGEKAKEENESPPWPSCWRSQDEDANG